MPEPTPSTSLTAAPDNPLRAIAAARGIGDGYWDIWGAWHETPDPVRLAILSSLGIGAHGGEAPQQSFEKALEQDRRSEWEPLTEETVVASITGAPAAIWLRIPTDRAGGDAEFEIHLEGGASRHWSVPLSACADQEQGEWNGVGHTRKRVQLPDDLPLGYHQLTARIKGTPELVSRTQLILCPDRAWLPETLERGERHAGVAVSLYGVHSGRTWGCGDFTALREIIDWVAEETGGSYIALNPLHAIHNRSPYNTSPYLPNCLYYRNFLYLDIDGIPELERSRWGQALRSSARIQAEIKALQDSELVEYERIHALKLLFLKVLYRTFVREELRPRTGRGAAFARWVEEEGTLLERYAIYCALDERMHRRCAEVWTWPDWPVEYQEAGSAAVAEFARKNRRAIEFHKYVQWLADQQAAAAHAYAKQRGLAIGLFHDLPLATDRCGFELWAHREFYVNGCRVGAPPDGFSPKGQDWSFPPPNHERHRQDGYRLFAESIRKSARHGGALRLDHVMRLFRLYWIPDGFDATQGAYVLDRHEDLLRVLALESVRQQVLIIGEDLGTVEPYMREGLARFGILSYRLFYFERDKDGRFLAPSEYPAQALVSSTTHDLPTLAGFWSFRDIEQRRDLGLLLDAASYHQLTDARRQEKRKMVEALVGGGFLAAELAQGATESVELSGELHSAITGFLVSTPSLLMTLNQEDLTKEMDQQNMPGTTHEYPNWRRKMKYTVEELRRLPAVRDFARMFRNWLKKSGRERQ
ncbi:MAG: 4-alpha-glucanotransferase [Acidobacteriia bacterium]|nr:4-alpha-glucanotransferase [Terriglobia bacterium]